mmetsp:Transcript_7159/g.16348  ORF Transcript_7159/g.16348 Transcript_7159/m.16348 type:complete len:254 (+) Transcript_7159:507-1268(+)
MTCSPSSRRSARRASSTACGSWDGQTRSSRERGLSHLDRRWLDAQSRADSSCTARTSSRTSLAARTARSTRRSRWLDRTRRLSCPAADRGRASVETSSSSDSRRRDAPDSSPTEACATPTRSSTTGSPCTRTARRQSRDRTRTGLGSATASSTAEAWSCAREMRLSETRMASSSFPPRWRSRCTTSRTAARRWRKSSRRSWRRTRDRRDATTRSCLERSKRTRRSASFLRPRALTRRSTTPPPPPRASAAAAR